jgi:hypothetical protein
MFPHLLIANLRRAVMLRPGQSFFVWPGRSHVRVFARHRRVRGVTPTRLSDSPPKRVRFRCHFLWQFGKGRRAPQTPATTEGVSS